MSEPQNEYQPTPEEMETARLVTELHHRIADVFEYMPDDPMLSVTHPVIVAAVATFQRNNMPQGDIHNVSMGIYVGWLLAQTIEDTPLPEGTALLPREHVELKRCDCVHSDEDVAELARRIRQAQIMKSALRDAKEKMRQQFEASIDPETRDKLAAMGVNLSEMMPEAKVVSADELKEMIRSGQLPGLSSEEPPAGTGLYL